MDPRDSVECSTCRYYKKVAEVTVNKFDGMWLFRCDHHGVHLPHVAVDKICRDFQDVIEGRNESEVFRAYAGLDLKDLEPGFLYWKDSLPVYPVRRGKMIEFSQLKSAINPDGTFLARHIRERMNHKDKKN